MKCKFQRLLVLESKRKRRRRKPNIKVSWEIKMKQIKQNKTVVKLDFFCLLILIFFFNRNGTCPCRMEFNRRFILLRVQASCTKWQQQQPANDCSQNDSNGKHVACSRS